MKKTFLLKEWLNAVIGLQISLEICGTNIRTVCKEKNKLNKKETPVALVLVLGCSTVCVLIFPFILIVKIGFKNIFLNTRNLDLPTPFYTFIAF